MKGWSVIGLVVLVAMLAAGCATSKEEVHLAQGGGMYSSLDATAQVYSSPRAQAPIEDNPWRWLGIVMHPFGVMLDYTINRPFYALASAFPDTFGYTAEDVLVESQRRR